MHDTYLNAQYNRIERRRGPKKAIIAVAASILTSAYHMLKNECDYIDLGPDFLQKLGRRGSGRRLASCPPAMAGTRRWLRSSELIEVQKGTCP